MAHAVLIDHSRANSLLFYRDLKVGTLDLTAETEAVDRLLAGEKLRIESLVSAGRDAQSPDPVARARAEGEARQKDLVPVERSIWRSSTDHGPH